MREDNYTIQCSVAIANLLNIMFTVQNIPFWPFETPAYLRFLIGAFTQFIQLNTVKGLNFARDLISRISRGTEIREIKSPRKSMQVYPSSVGKLMYLAVVTLDSRKTHQK